ncbi:G protein-regulated inducer of neurite outgrowth 1 [Mixophyes fleayi]|uniref:G protein-regulated inducer of neurite outgrowth 1 n=1 Tax=Mixophyes fleayi TaxID=3061075 RepID=UPI003F4E44A4
MGSPKQPQRLQLSRPDAASETVSLRSPISSRIWQAEDPTRNSGFDGEDLCMRHFCVSVNVDHEPMDGSFSFDTGGDGILEVHRDFSMDTDGTYSFHESREDQTRPIEESTNVTSVFNVKEASDKDSPNSENVMDCKKHMLNAANAPEASPSLALNTGIDPRDLDTRQGTLKDISLKDKKKEIDHGNSELIQVVSSLGNEISRENLAEGLAGCKDVANGEQNIKTHTSELIPSNNLSDTQEKQYRSIAISPIVPPDGSSSFTFQTDTRAQKTSSVLSCEVRLDGKEISKKEDLSKAPSFELTPPNHNDGTETKVQYRSVAVSPIIPPGDTSSFTFQTDHGSKAQEDLKVCGTHQRTDALGTDNFPKVCSPEFIPCSHNDGTQSRVEYKSVAVSPIIPPEGSSFTFHALRTVSGNTAGTHCTDLLPKTYSFELTPPNQDVGTQADTRAECVSVAVSPIIPPDGSSSFIFQSEQLLNKISGGKELENKWNHVKPSHAQDEGASTQAATKVQCVSVAISPIVLPGGASSFTFLAEKSSLSPATEHNKDNNIKSTDNLPKTYSFELTPPDEEASTVTRVEYRSVAVSPIIPPDEVSFTFQNEKKKDPSCVDVLPKTYSFELTPPDQDIGTQANTRVECVSVAVSPIVISQGSSFFPFQTDQMTPHLEQTQKQNACSISALPKTSLELTPQYQDVGIQVDTTTQCTSIAVSPIIPLQGSCSFVFHSEGINQASTVCSHLQEKPLMKDAEMQVCFPVETRSIATDPMTPRGKSPQASYPEVRVKEAKAVHPEPVREVSWDEKGMTWEVYGASMEVEVLGMAIQKHLEKQIEEHGRQKVMTPQSTRGSSVRGAAVKSESKRQPGAFRGIFHSVRRPRCCSRSGPVVE